MTTNVTVRLLLTNKEAGIIIGTKGVTIEEIRSDFDVKVGISEHVDGCVDRICSLHGPLEDVAKAADFIADKLVKNQKLVRMLLSHFVIGTLIGKQGVNVKELQEQNIRVSCLDDLLPQSTDRIVLVIGDDVHFAITKIQGWIKDANSKNIYYDPSKLENNKGALYRTAPRKNSHDESDEAQASRPTKKKQHSAAVHKSAVVEKSSVVDKSASPSKSEDQNSLLGERVIIIPKSLQARVLGDKDVNLKQIGYDSGVKFYKKYRDDSSLAVTITGEDAQLNEAFQMFKKLSDE